MDVMLVADMSSSVADETEYIADALDDLVNRVELDEGGIHMGLITFNSETIIWTPQTSNVGAIKLAIEVGVRKRQAHGETRLANALMDALTLLSGARPDALKLIILISDGEPNSPTDSKLIANQIKSLPGYAIFGVFIEKESHYRYEGAGYDYSQFMEQISTVYVKTNYKQLGETIKQMDLCL